uniref:cytochrome b6/f complex subunit VI n=1 Tax=Taenitis blechnoides TaxID=32177 RepID=UPI002A8336D6|nr:cytochrome b6/f complex subunit VI [Taenitis blechnoides]WNR49211.1 cytochrome b6/f complex subunit VI [Taenitis blechnoides]
MFTLLSYFAFLMLTLTLTPALFVGLNKIQILQLILLQEKEMYRGKTGSSTDGAYQSVAFANEFIN